MKILHASDLHYSPANLVEADRCFGYAVDVAISRNVDVAIISGDSTDHPLEAHAPALRILAGRIKKLADHCPVLMLQGTFSHEPKGMLKMLEMIGANHPIYVADKIGMVGLADDTWIEIDNENIGGAFDLVVTTVPTVNKAELALAVGADNANVEMGNHIAALLATFGPVNAALRRRGIPTVLTAHGTVDGSMNENGVPMAGLDHEFSAGALFSANANASMLGHIHKHQAWERSHEGRVQRLAYAGGCGRFHYGEDGDKYVLEWEVTADRTDITPHATPSRRLIDITFPGVPDLDQLAAVAAQCADSYVRVRYSVDEEFASTIDRNAIRQILGGAAELKIEGEVLAVQRQRCAGISTLSTIPERFAKWCEHSDTPMEGLEDRLAALQTMRPEEIASQFFDSLATIKVPAPTDAEVHRAPAAVADELDDVML